MVIPTRTLARATSDLRGHFYALLDTLATIRELTDLELSGRPESRLVGEALAALVRHQEVERCALYLLGDGELRYAGGHGWRALMGVEGAEEPGGEQAFAFAGGLPREAVASGRVIAVPDCARDPRLAPGARGSLLWVPVAVREAVLGVLGAYHPQAGRFESWHVHALELFCSVLAHVIENGRVLRDTEEVVAERTARLESALRETEQLKLRYERLSNVDELTQLPNRRFFFPQAEAALARATRYGHPFSLMLMDIDHFKRINDRHGHAVGDRILRDVGATLREEVREGDIIARFGGEEFVVALPSTTVEGARPVAMRIVERVAELGWEVEGALVRTTLSLGLSELGERDGPSSRMLLETLLSEADIAMYYCKRHGRNRMCAYPEVPEDERVFRDD